MGIFEFIYYLGYSAKKYYSVRNQKKLPYKVISIGNITTGGTGKTPATIALAKEAKRRGFYPIILTRGYKGKAKGPLIIPPLARGGAGGVKEREDVLFKPVELFGDEPVLMAERLKDVPIVKCADRYEGGMFAIQNLNFQLSTFNSQLLFILDDGFQHWRLFRDKDILLIDAENPFDNKRLLPIGLLREPLKEINRASIIVITKTGSSQSATHGQPSVSSLTEEIRRYNSTAPIFSAEHKPTGFIKPSGEMLPPGSVKDKNLYAFCGIGNPESFKRTILSINETLMRLGSQRDMKITPLNPPLARGDLRGVVSEQNLKGFKAYRDHYKYEQRDIDNILLEAQKNNADWIITTEKDLVRLKGLTLPENLLALTIEFSVDEGFYNEAFK